jgi:hypothetical protein
MDDVKRRWGMDIGYVYSQHNYKIHHMHNVQSKHSIA